MKGNHEDDKDQTINDLQLQNKSYADQIDSANASIADLEGQVEQLQEENSYLDGQLQELAETNEQLTSQVEELDSQLLETEAWEAYYKTFYTGK